MISASEYLILFGIFTKNFAQGFQIENEAGNSMSISILCKIHHKS